MAGDFENRIDFSTADAPHQPGGSLPAYAAHLRENSEIAVLTASDRQLWFCDSAKALLRLPHDCYEPVDTRTTNQLLREKTIWMLSYLTQSSSAVESNSFHYICDNRDYSIDGLDKKIRRDVRRGGRSFDVRLTSWSELGASGLAAWADTDARHGYKLTNQQDLEKMIRRNSSTPFYELWGAWDGDNLAAWYQVIKIDNWAMINVARSQTESLKNCPNNAIVYAITKRMLVGENRDYVTYGLSSSQVFASESSMHRFKCKMGYEPVACKRVFAPHFLLKPLFYAPFAPQAWRLAAKLFKGSAAVRKLAGISELMKNRSTESLSWAEKK